MQQCALRHIKTISLVSIYLNSSELSWCVFLQSLPTLTFHMTVQTVHLLQVRPGVDEDEGRDHGGVPRVGSCVGGTLTSTNHHHLPVPGHAGNVLTCLHNPNLQKFRQFPYSLPSV